MDNDYNIRTARLDTPNYPNGNSIIHIQLMFKRNMNTFYNLHYTFSIVDVREKNIHICFAFHRFLPSVNANLFCIVSIVVSHPFDRHLRFDVQFCL